MQTTTSSKKNVLKSIFVVRYDVLMKNSIFNQKKKKNMLHSKRVNNSKKEGEEVFIFLLEEK